MKTIHKYTLHGTGETIVQGHAGARFLSAGNQPGVIVVWAEVDDEMYLTNYNLCVYGTGWELSENEKRFIGTVQDTDGYVWHIYEEF